MYNIRRAILPLLTTLLVVGPVTGEESEDRDVLESEMIERFAVGMGRIANKKLSDTGLSQEDAARIAAEVSDRIKTCTSEVVDKQSDAAPSEVNAAEDEFDMCVQVAFENAGIRYP